VIGPPILETPPHTNPANFAIEKSPSVLQKMENFVKIEHFQSSGKVAVSEIQGQCARMAPMRGGNLIKIVQWERLYSMWQYSHTPLL